MNQTPPAPLTGMKVLDLSRLLPGPYTTQLLADMGAEVIKVETPLLGDYARIAPPEFGGNLVFKFVNRGKKSFSVNYRNKRGKEIFYRLAETSDVIVETSKPGSVDRWGIGYEAIRAINPRIVYCSISGYGQDGPLRDRVGHDINYIALSGLLDLTGTAGGPPVLPAIQTADLAGATMAATAILGALLQRHTTGKGQFLDISMLDAIFHWVTTTAGSLELQGTEPQRGRMPLTGGSPCTNVYETADGRFLTLGALETPFWKTFCLTAGRPDLVPFPFDEAYIPEVRALFLEKSAGEWLTMFRGTDVPIEPVLSAAESQRHEQLRYRGLLDLDGPELNSPFPFPQADGPAPDWGQHTREILLEMGYAEEEIAELVKKKIIRVREIGEDPTRAVGDRWLPS